MPKIQALMVDVDGVLVTGRPQDGRHWQASLAADLAIDVEALNASFFRTHWTAIVTGREDLRPWLAKALRQIAPACLHRPVDRLLVPQRRPTGHQPAVGGRRRQAPWRAGSSGDQPGA